VIKIRDRCFLEFNISSAIDSSTVLLFIKIFKTTFTFGFKQTIDEILSRVLNQTGFVKPLKDCQNDCLVHVLSKNDVIAILPTGYGKSFIFQRPHVRFVLLFNKLFKVLYGLYILIYIYRPVM
jgi:superfamily II DNA helicase RecQ